jgi:hypothetical protein
LKPQETLFSKPVAAYVTALQVPVSACLPALSTDVNNGVLSRDLDETVSAISTPIYFCKQHHLPQSLINMKLLSHPETLFDTTHCAFTFTMDSKTVIRYLKLKLPLLTAKILTG